MPKMKFLATEVQKLQPKQIGRQTRLKLLPIPLRGWYKFTYLIRVQLQMRFQRTKSMEDFAAKVAQY